MTLIYIGPGIGAATLIIVIVVLLIILASVITLFLKPIKSFINKSIRLFKRS